MQTQRQVAANPQTKLTDFGCEVRRYASVIHITIAIYYYAARKLTLVSPSHGGWKAESTWTLQEGCAAGTQGSGCRDKHTLPHRPLRPACIGTWV